MGYTYPEQLILYTTCQRTQFVKCGGIKMTDEQFNQRYAALAHAVQTGIGWKIAIDNPDVFDINQDKNLCAHKHLRVGIDTNKADLGALCRLLVSKGIITDEEYKIAILEGLENEKKMYEITLSEHFGKDITLG